MMSVAVPEAYLPTLNSEAWFDTLPQPVKHDILAAASLRSYRPRQQVYHRGERTDGMFAVLQGVVCISGITMGGVHSILDYYGPGTWFGEVAVLGGFPRSFDTEALRETQLLHLGSEATESLLLRHPAFARALLRLEAQRLHLLLDAIERYSTQSLEQRLAFRLLLLARQHSQPASEGVELHLPLSQETLGKLIGSTRQRVNQILRQWEDLGIVRCQVRRLVMLKPDWLEKLLRS